ncbi:Branched-chain-amino-acid aminotransferase [Botrimarina colliarenosi]|uniref:branched-chain-amino-acid transaminase n=1 Tax=Botrimarina colliarenosi TaxID=2528001 RepID=A0A5C6AIT8_9BACT|nr:aminotransferase class IV [Botrimarina colliarenosi]TWT99085.1 Branched-chain-amino-acid aminotransferase [Botrimarina colliarenosi]
MPAVAVQPTANIDGVLSPLDDARIPVLDRGFLYGDSVYEVFRTYDGVPLFWREHFERMENSARLIHMPIAQSREELMAEIRRAVAAAGGRPSEDGTGEVYVRWHLSRGVGPVDLYPDPNLRTSFMIFVKPVPKWKQAHCEVGMRLAVTDVRRNAADALSPNIKSGNYLNNILGLAEAVERGADDCLMLNHEGYATEASNSNIFFVTDGKVQTPADSAGNLRGITGAALRKIGAAAGWPIHEELLTVDDLSQVDEAFVTSATREVMPVAAIRLPSGQWRELPPGGGPLTRQIAQAYKDYVAEYVVAEANARLW